MKYNSRQNRIKMKEDRQKFIIIVINHICIIISINNDHFMFESQ